MKTALTSPPVLALFREGRETRVELDASAIAVGGVLSQKDEETGKWHPIAYYSQKMPPKFQNEVAYDLELQGLVKTLNHFRESSMGAQNLMSLQTICRSLISQSQNSSQAGDWQGWFPSWLTTILL